MLSASRQWILNSGERGSFKGDQDVVKDNKSDIFSIVCILQAPTSPNNTNALFFFCILVLFFIALFMYLSDWLSSGGCCLLQSGIWGGGGDNGQKNFFVKDKKNSHWKGHKGLCVTEPCQGVSYYISVSPTGWAWEWHQKECDQRKQVSHSPNVQHVK